MFEEKQLAEQVACSSSKSEQDAWSELNQAERLYHKPPQIILDALHAPVSPHVSFSPTRAYMLLLECPRYPSLSQLARPVLGLAGLRLDPRNNGPHHAPRFTGLKLKRLCAQGEVCLLLPHGARVGYPQWSPDGRRFVFTNTTDDMVELWLCEAESGHARRLDGLRLNAAYGSPGEWLPDSSTLLVQLIPEGRGKPPLAPVTPAGPNIQESSRKHGLIRTHRNLLRSPHDEELFDYYATSQLALVDLQSDQVMMLGVPAIFQMVEPSPDGECFLVAHVERPYSYLHPASAFPREVEGWSRKARVLYKLANRPLADEVPLDGVPTGPREYRWHPLEPATLVWVEALDGGDPQRPVPHRDHVLTLPAPCTAQPRALVRTEHRFNGLRWTEDGTRALVSDYDRERRWRRTLLIETGVGCAAPPRTLWSHSVQDRYRRRGTPVSRALANGHYAVWQHEDAIFLSGEGATPQGDRPFLDRLDLKSLQTERLFQSDANCREEVVALLSDDGTRFVTCRQSPTEPHNYFIREVRQRRAAGVPTVAAGGRRKQARASAAQALTRFIDPAPQLRAIEQRLITYERADGVLLSCTLYLPPCYRQGTLLPAVLWAYPQEFNDAATAGQSNSAAQRFTTIHGASPLFLLLAGYAVLHHAAMPIVGPPATVNDTYLEQLVMNAQAAVEKVVALGVVERERIGVGGHSYGAAMVANLLAHSQLFRAGVALSGAYNRTLTPFGFQRERRTLWEDAELYGRVSPLMHAPKISAPLLLIHGEADDNAGTHPLQSERMYQAVCGNGGTARLVLLPHEAHTYAARESVEHTLHEMITWFDKHMQTA